MFVIYFFFVKKKRIIFEIEVYVSVIWLIIFLIFNVENNDNNMNWYYFKILSRKYFIWLV